ncbi:MAG: Gldg family protein [Planctomycetes bacterium]|nr:Gldg family protein [Planctomycetota bacterium]
MNQRRWKFRATNLVFLAGLIGITIVINILVNQLPSSYARIDCTEGQIYTLSSSTREIFSELKDVIRIKYFVSKDLPTFFRDLPEQTKDFMRELQMIAGDKLEFEVIDPEEYIKQEAARIAAEREEKKKQAEAEGKEYKEEDEFDPMDFMNPMGGQRRKLSDEEKARRQLAQQGIQLLRGQDLVKSTKLEVVEFYTAIKIDYRGKPSEVIPTHQDMENLEYELASRVLKLVSDKKKTVAFFDGQPNKEPPRPQMPGQPPQMPESDYSALLQFLREHFDVDEIELTETSKLPHRDAIKLSWSSYGSASEAEEAKRKEFEIKWTTEEPPVQRGEAIPGFDAGKEAEDLWLTILDKDARTIVGPIEREGKFYLYRADSKDIRPDCLVVAQPKGLNERQKLEINKFVSEGGNTIFLDGKFQVDVEGGQRVAPLDSGLEDVYKSWGVELGTRTVNDMQMAGLPVQRRVRVQGVGYIVVPSMMQLPSLVVVDAQGMDLKSPLTRGFRNVILPWPCGVKIDKATIETNKVEVLSDLFRSSEETWLGPAFAMSLDQLSGDDWEERIKKKDFDERQVLAVHLKGVFPFTKYEGKPVPAWPKVEEKAAGGFDDKETFGRGGGAEEPADAAPDAEPKAETPAVAPEAKVEAPAPEAEPKAAEKTAEPEPKASESPGEKKAGEPAAPEAEPKAEPKKAEPAPELAKLDRPAAEANVIVVSSPDCVKTIWLKVNQDAYSGNFVFLRNAVEAFSLGEKLIRIRAKTVIPRPLLKGDEWDGTKLFWQWFNIAGVPGIVIVVGAVRVLLRKQTAWRYESRARAKRGTTGAAA